MVERFLVFIFFTLSGLTACLQVESTSYTFFSPRYSIQTPQADMATRFGVNSSLGLTFGVKKETDFYLGGNANFLFGNNVKEPSLLKNLLGFSGISVNGDSVFEIIGQENRPAVVLIQQRGFNFSGDFGKLFRFKNSDHESGVLVTMGLGFLQHKIRLETQLDEVPQLEGEYIKGYDRLTNGVMLSQNVGWMFLNTRRGGSFYAGIEVIEGFTQSRRSYNFDTKISELGMTRLDILTGIKVAWIVPFYRRNLQ